MGKTMVRRARKGIDEVVRYALGHKIRIQVLVALNEGIFTAAELSRIIGVPQKTLQNHLRRMVEDGSIEIAKEEEVGNRTRFWYRSVVVHSYTAEELERLPWRYRQNIAGAILHSGIAEVMAGFHAGKLAEPGAHAYWDWYNVDDQGREDADALTHRTLEGLRKIEAESLARTKGGGGAVTSLLLNFLLFERPRKGANRPHRFVAERGPQRPAPPISARVCAAQRHFGWGDHHPWS